MFLAVLFIEIQIFFNSSFLGNCDSFNNAENIVESLFRTFNPRGWSKLRLYFIILKLFLTTKNLIREDQILKWEAYTNTVTKPRGEKEDLILLKQKKLIPHIDGFHFETNCISQRGQVLLHAYWVQLTYQFQNNRSP